MAESQLSSILLLLCLSVVIYYLTRPTTVKNEGTIDPNNDAIETDSDQDTTVENTDVSGYNNTNDTYASVNQQEQAVATNAAVTNAAVTNAAVTNAAVTNATVINAPAPIATNAVANQQAVNSYVPNEYSSGASLEFAYDKPVPEGTDTKGIDFNRNNVVEYDNKDYLPQDVNDEWFETDFTSAQNRVDDNNLVTTDRYVIGINTVGQSLKNPSYDLRGTIPNPKFTVSPWNNSTYEPDFNIKSLC